MRETDARTVRRTSAIIFAAVKASAVKASDGLVALYVNMLAEEALPASVGTKSSCKKT